MQTFRYRRIKHRAFMFVAGLAFWSSLVAFQALAGAVTDNASPIVSTQSQR